MQVYAALLHAYAHTHILNAASFSCFPALSTSVSPRFPSYSSDPIFPIIISPDAVCFPGQRRTHVEPSSNSFAWFDVSFMIISLVLTLCSIPLSLQLKCGLAQAISLNWRSIVGGRR